MTETIYTLSSDPNQTIYPQLSWCKLPLVKRARVLVVGCGALGNEVLKNLVLFGVEQIVLLDFDRVEPANLTRSVLFTPDDATRHRPKVEAAARTLRSLNPAVRLWTIEGDITHDLGLGLLRQMQVAIGCVDNRWARFYLNRLCMRAGISWVDGGIEGLEGTVRVFRPGENCYACNLGPEGKKELARRFSCAHTIRRNEQAGRAATTPVIASIIGAVQVQEALKLLHPEEMARGELTSLCGKMFYYEGQHLTTRTVAFQGYDEECPEHAGWQPVRTAGFTHKVTVAEALRQLRSLSGWEDAVICLPDHPFVDYLVERESDRRIPVGLPSHAVEAFLTQDPIYGQKPLHAFYQHEIHRIDAHFPQPELTLQQVGIPSCDILCVERGDTRTYVELAPTPELESFLKS